jgi:hypothetical protein
MQKSQAIRQDHTYQEEDHHHHQKDQEDQYQRRTPHNLPKWKRNIKNREAALRRKVALRQEEKREAPQYVQQIEEKREALQHVQQFEEKREAPPYVQQVQKKREAPPYVQQVQKTSIWQSNSFPPPPIIGSSINASHSSICSSVSTSHQQSTEGRRNSDTASYHSDIIYDHSETESNCSVQNYSNQFGQQHNYSKYCQCIKCIRKRNKYRQYPTTIQNFYIDPTTSCFDQPIQDSAPILCLDPTYKEVIKPLKRYMHNPYDMENTRIYLSTPDSKQMSIEKAFSPS